MGAHVTKPGGYRQSAEEQMFCVLILCIPYYQSLLFAGISGLLSYFLLTVLLMFVVSRSPALHRVISLCLRAFPASWISPTLDRREHWISALAVLASPEPALAPTFQRPPPHLA
jgi:hypothetical protein